MNQFAVKSREPMWACPNCRKSAFGILSINDSSYVRRCNDCAYSARFLLPSLNKKIIYLDQVAISFLAKLDCERNSKWIRVRTAIEHALCAEAIVIPYSEFHEQESAVAKTLAENLRKLYQRLSRGVSYRSTVEVQKLQIYDALKQFVREPLKKTATWHHALAEDPNVWSKEYFVVVNMKDMTNKYDRFQAVKQRIAFEAKSLNETFKKMHLTFEEQYRLELRQEARNIWELYIQDKKRRQAASSAEEAFAALLCGTPFADTGRMILDFFKERGHRGEALGKMFVDFLISTKFEAVDYVRIGSALFAGLAMKVKGQRGLLKANDFIDISAIEYYAPYCDAMFIDNSMCHLISTPPVCNKLCLKTKFFCSKSIDSFIAYLEQVGKDSPLALQKPEDILQGFVGDGGAP